MGIIRDIEVLGLGVSLQNPSTGVKENFSQGIMYAVLERLYAGIVGEMLGTLRCVALLVLYKKSCGA